MQICPYDKLNCNNCEYYKYDEDRSTKYGETIYSCYLPNDEYNIAQLKMAINNFYSTKNKKERDTP